MSDRDYSHEDRYYSGAMDEQERILEIIQKMFDESPFFSTRVTLLEVRKKVEGGQES